MEDRFVRGVYNLELQRFRKGIYSRLVTEDPDRYYERELDRLSQLTSQKDAHLVKSLEHISLGRQKQIVIFLDNVDQRSDDVQQKVFVMAHSIASEWPAAIFVAIRPETYNRSKRDGALSGYHTKAFTIAPPRIDLVLEKRLQFGLRVTSGMIPVAILQQATKDSVRNLEIFLKVMQQSFEYNDKLVELIDNIAGGNVRLALELIEGFVGSGHIDTRKIINAYNSRGRYRIPVHELLRTIMHGNNRYYAPISTPIVNIFDIILPDKKEHFLTYSLLSWLRHNTSIGNHGFVPLEQLYNYAQKIGFQVIQINYAIERMCKFNLAETSGRVQPIGSDPRITSMRVTQSGVYHITILANKFNYIDTMIVDTPILEKSFEERMNITTTSIRIRLQRTNIFLDYLDECWREYESNDEVISWDHVSKEARANVIHIEQLMSI